MIRDPRTTVKWTLVGVLALAATATAVMTTSCTVRADVKPAAAEPRWSGTFVERFENDTVVNESRSPEMSSSEDWWLGSGGWLIAENGVGRTNSGEASVGYLRSRYALRNPVDTDGGRHPQNLFRVVTRQTWDGDIRQQGYFRIRDYHTTESPQRYAPNGLLLFNRYSDENNLYYAGVRVDGHAVVKKKSQGVYYTLAEKEILPGDYDREQNPILLPKDTWIGLRSIVRDNADGSTTVSLYWDKGRTDEWELLLEAVDAGVGGDPFRSGRTGIRTDFMDAEFDDYVVSLASDENTAGAAVSR